MSNELEKLYFEYITRAKDHGMQTPYQPEDPDPEDINNWAVFTIGELESMVHGLSMKLAKLKAEHENLEPCNGDHEKSFIFWPAGTTKLSWKNENEILIQSQYRGSHIIDGGDFQSFLSALCSTTKID